MEAKKNRRVLLVVVIVVIVAAAVLALLFIFGPLSGRQVKPAAPLTTLRIGGPLQELNTLIYVADEKGFFNENGIEADIKVYSSGVESVQRLISGEIDIALTSEFVFVNFSFDNSDLRIVGSITEANVMEIVGRKDRGIQTGNDIAGKKVGLTRKSSTESFMGNYLLSKGIAYDDVELVNLPPLELVEGLKDGSLDAVVTWPPHVFNLKSEMGDVVFTESIQSGQNFYWLAVQKAEQIEKAVTEKFLAAVIKAEEFTKENTVEAQNIMMSRLQKGEAYKDYYWNRHDFRVSLPQSLILFMEDEAEWAVETGLTSKETVPNYLEYFYFDAMDAADSRRISIIR